jgi:hypothetical protein
MDHPDIDASDIEVTVSDAEVTLSGQTARRHEKRLAEEIAEDVLGVKDVVNRLHVERERQDIGVGMSGGRAATTGTPGATANAGPQRTTANATR